MSVVSQLVFSGLYSIKSYCVPQEEAVIAEKPTTTAEEITQDIKNLIASVSW